MNTTRTTEEINRELRTLSDKIAANPNDAQLYFDRAYLYQTNDAPAELVMKDYLKAIELDNQFGAAYTNIAFCLMQQRQFGDALRYSEKAVSLCPESAEASINYAGCLRHTGRLDEAFQAAKQALELAPKNANAHSVYLGNLPMEYDVYAAFERSWPFIRDHKALAALCGNYMSNRRAYDKAIECYNQYGALTGCEQHALLAPCYEKLNLLDEAETHYLKCIDSDTNEYEHLIQFYVSHERYDDARKWIEKGQSLFPDSPVWASTKMAMCKAKADDKGFVAAAVELINTFAQLDEEEQDSYADYPGLDDEITADRISGADAVSTLLQYTDEMSLGLWSNILSTWFGMDCSWAEKCTEYMKWWDAYLREKKYPSENQRQHAVSVLGFHADILSSKWEYAIHNSPAEVVRLRIMMDLLELVVRLSAVKRADTVLPESWAQGFAFYTKLSAKMQEKYAKLLVDVERKKQQEIAAAIISAKDDLMQGFSHKMKNSFPKAINEIELLKGRVGEDAHVHKSVMLLRRMEKLAHAINFSFKGGKAELAADLTQSGSGERLSHVIAASLDNALANLLDESGIYADFAERYFSLSEEKAVRAEYRELDTKDLPALCALMTVYMMDVTVDIADDADCMVGDHHHTLTKLTEIIEELIFNAIKYAGTAPRERRFLRIALHKEHHGIALDIENAHDCDASSPSTSGLGRQIVANTLEAMEIDYQTEDKNGTYLAHLGIGS